ncbi:GlsB/YeaQ/YmgE family stress response membrane protein [Agrococcus baldri]|uniref:Transglycosylase n=1 Tax=Agrococcus baldri TaxID=153730 RepID=A0AA87UQP5_9MICO|nr:GlsB/YeaQ/YmgE family stress response membrane protein [Agrococcus baldri]GEK78719.1 transglycosylase [Agrococcus baldri]
MGFLVFLIFGLIAGALAKLILPGKQGGGWIVTLLLGVVGAMLGGWIAGLFGQDVYTSFFSPLGWLFAIGGAIIVLLIWGLITKNRGKTSA